MTFGPQGSGAADVMLRLLVNQGVTELNAMQQRPLYMQLLFPAKVTKNDGNFLSLNIVCLGLPGVYQHLLHHR
jgi:hypothetical protein